MPKYTFDRMNGQQFQQMAQALLERRLRAHGQLTQFKETSDGGREATWSQPPTHPDYARPDGATTDVNREWVFQVKLHSAADRGWKSAAEALIQDLQHELEKITAKYKVPCHTYILITNVPLTGNRYVGTRDRISAVAKSWHDRIADVQVWDAADLSRMLDADRDVRTAYLDLILPGDILAALLRNAETEAHAVASTFRAYLHWVIDAEGGARAEDAGDEGHLPLADVFVDLPLEPECETAQELVQEWFGRRRGRAPRRRARQARASLAFLLAEFPHITLLAGPGRGKSTIGQFLALYHAARVVEPELASQLAARLALPQQMSPDQLEALCEPRIPFRIELKRYSDWLKDDNVEGPRGLARYIAEHLINANTEGTLTAESIFDVAASDAVLLILDGLDEVPDAASRKAILTHANAFIRRADASNKRLQCVVSSRPDGYGAEFDRFDPVRWSIADLSREDFDSYCGAWLSKRIRNTAERQDAQNRIARGMKSDSVSRLATTLLQATVMLTIVRKRIEIPPQMHKLYDTYVNVIFDREKTKSDLVNTYEDELRHLHAVAGYRLHIAVSTGGQGKLSETDFRTLVTETWVNFRGREDFHGKLAAVISDITKAARDRLVFLSGTGEDQSNVEFVIQSFREFFAAQYLHTHPESDPAQVLNSLVRRGPFWSNVLHFYVACKDPAQQLLMLHEVDSGPKEPGDIDGHLKLRNTCRALLRVLPEFHRLQLHALRHALTVLFPHNFRWMWYGDDLPVDVLQPLQGGDGARIARELCEEWIPLDVDSSEVLLQMGSELATPGGADDKRWCEFVSKCGTDLRLQRAAIEAIIQYDLDVELEAFPVDAVVKAIRCVRERDFGGSRWLRRVRQDGAAKMTVRRSNSEIGAARYVLWPIRRNAIEFWNAGGYPSNWFSTFKGEIFSYWDVYPFWQRSVAGDIEDAKFAPTGHGGPCFQYCRALADAAARPASPELDGAARSAWNALPYPGPIALAPTAVLGPGVESFHSVDDWKRFKIGVDQIAQRPREFEAAVRELGEVDGTWPLLLFHPRHWEVLSEEGLATFASASAARKSRLGRLLGIPHSPVPVIGPAPEALEIGMQETPLLPLVKAAMRICRTDGPKALPVIAFVKSRELQFSDHELTATELESLIEQAQKLPEIPETWLFALLKVLTRCKYTRAEHLVKLCEKHGVPQMPVGGRGSEQDTNGGDQWMGELLRQVVNDGAKIALPLSIWMATGGMNWPADKTEANTMASRLESEFDNRSTWEGRSKVLRLLLRLPIADAQVRMWRNGGLACEMATKEPGMFKRWCDRIRVWHRHDIEVIRENPVEAIEHILAHRSDYPLSMWAAALAGLTPIWHERAPILCDNDWRRLKHDRSV